MPEGVSGSISAMPSEIAAWLGEQDEVFPDVRFITEFPHENKQTPLRSAVCAVGLESVSLTDLFVENEHGEREREEYCRRASVCVRLSIYVPFSAGGSACHEVFTRVMDCLNFNSDLNIIESSCGSVRADRDTDAFVLKSLVTFDAEFCPAETSEIQYRSFLPKTFFCASHLDNEDIHVTPEDKERWNALPLSVGAYFGNGGTRTVSLGKRPNGVIIFASGLPPVYSPDSVSSLNHTGFAAGAYSSPGLTLTSDGFSVTSSGLPDYGGSRMCLNEAGTGYAYIWW